MLLVAGLASAFTVPTPTGFVTDTTGKIKPADLASLNAEISAYNQRTSNEIAVLFVPTLGGENLEDVTHQVFQTYKVGKSGLDNGVLLFVALNDRKMRLQTGKGVEGDLPDILTKKILTSMQPSFRAGDFAGGVRIAVNQVESVLDSRKGQKVDPGQGQQFNQVVPQEQAVTSGSQVHSNSCAVGPVGNAVGFGLGLFALLLTLIACARRYIRYNEARKMAALEAKVEAEMEAERKAAAEEVAREERKAKHDEMLRQQRKLEVDLARAKAVKDEERRQANLAAEKLAREERLAAPLKETQDHMRSTTEMPKAKLYAKEYVKPHDEVPVRRPEHDVAERATREREAAAEKEREVARSKARAAEAAREAEREAQRQEERARARRREEEEASARRQRCRVGRHG